MPHPPRKKGVGISTLARGMFTQLFGWREGIRVQGLELRGSRVRSPWSHLWLEAQCNAFQDEGKGLKEPE